MNDAEPKPLIASKTPPVVVLSALLGWLAGRYGLDLPADASAALAGSLVALASYAMRYITSRPISGLVK